MTRAHERSKGHWQTTPDTSGSWARLRRNLRLHLEAQHSEMFDETVDGADGTGVRCQG
jgi:hypothetical protein